MATLAYQFIPQLSQSRLAAGERCEKHAAAGSIVSRVRNGAADSDHRSDRKMDLVVRRWNIEGNFSHVKPRRQKMVGMIEAPTSVPGTFRTCRGGQRRSVVRTIADMIC